MSILCALFVTFSREVLVLPLELTKLTLQEPVDKPCSCAMKRKNKVQKSLIKYTSLATL